MGAGAVSVEDMASVHLSSSKHWHLSQPSTGGGHCFLLFNSLLPSSPGLNSARNLFSLPFIYLHLAFHAYFSFFNLFFPRTHTLAPNLPHSLSLPGALGGTAHSATKQSCLQHHTAVNQAQPECSGFVVDANSRVDCGTGRCRKERATGQGQAR